MVKQKADEPLEEFAERCQSLANDAWADDNQDMADRSAMDAFLHGVLDTESAYSAMDKNPATVDEALDIVKRALHNWKALFGAQAKTIHNVSFMEENEGVEERHIHVVKACSPVPAPVEKIHKLEKSMVETKGQLDKILSLLERRSPWPGFSKPATPPRCHKCHEVGHFMRDCTAESRSRSPSPSPGNHANSPAKHNLKA